MQFVGLQGIANIFFFCFLQPFILIELKKYKMS